MDSNTKIGKVTQIIIKSSDQLGNTIETGFNKNFYVNEDATYSQVDTANRAVIQLSKNTYIDTICVTNISVNEVLAG